MYEYKTMIGDDLPSVTNLNELAQQGWEFVQLVTYATGMMNITEGQVCVYFRRLSTVPS